MRQSTITRNTNETQITLSLTLDGTGKSAISTGVGFLDHMLNLWTVHGLFDLSVTATGDHHIDFHHTVEDIGICLGLAFREALGTAKGIRRYSSLVLPMDEALAQVAIDVSTGSILPFPPQCLRQKLANLTPSWSKNFGMPL